MSFNTSVIINNNAAGAAAASDASNSLEESKTSVLVLSSSQNLSGGLSPFPCATPPDYGDTNQFPYIGCEVEPQVVVGKQFNSNKPLVIAYWQQDRMSRRGGAQADYFRVSKDGGVTWSAAKAVPYLVTCFQGQRERASDPQMSLAPDGRTLYFVSVALDSASKDESIVEIDRVMYDTVTGLFSHPNTFMTADQNLGPDYVSPDYPYMLADPDDDSGKTAYLVGSKFVYPDSGIFVSDIWFSKTTSRGSSWSAAKRIVNAPSGGELTAGSNDVQPGEQMIVKSGDRLIVGYSQVTGYNVGLSTVLSPNRVVYSDDGGNHWSAPIKTDSPNTVQGQCVDPDDSSIIRSADICPQMAVDPTRCNIVALVAQDDSLIYDLNPSPSKITVRISVDNGKHWSFKGKVNRSPSNVQAFGHAVCFTDDGSLAISYYDFRNYAGTSTTVPLSCDRWMAVYDVSNNGSLTFKQELRLTPTSFDNRSSARLLGGATNLSPPGMFLGDYFGQKNYKRKIYHTFAVVPSTATPSAPLSDIYLSILSY